MVGAMRSRPVLFALFAASLAWIASPRSAAANMAQAVTEGERFGALVPRKSTSVRVERETLTFDIAPDLGSATVKATYRMAADEATAVEVAFAMVDASPRRENEPTPVVTIDGAHMSYRTVHMDELLGPRLGQWIGAHPNVARTLGKSGAGAELAAAVKAAGGSCTSDCDALARWKQAMTGGEQLAPEELGQVTFEAARDVIPGEVDALTKGWSALGTPRRLVWLAFLLDMKAGKTREVTVAYRHFPSEDRAAHVNSTYVYDYLLSPAKAWASFGPIDVVVRAPAGASITSSVPFVEEGDTRKATLPGLPEGELRISAMSRKGLWLGMTTSKGYWAIVIAAMMGAAIAVGKLTGKLWRGRSALIRIVLGGALASFAAGVVGGLLSAVMPTRALGFGYGGPLGVLLLIVLAGPVGIVMSFAAARRNAA